MNAFTSACHNAETYVSKLEAELPDCDKQQTWHILRGTLHALRDRIQPDEACHLAEQLPLVVRGAFFEAFRPGRGVRKMDADTFLADVAAQVRVDPPKNLEEKVWTALSYVLGSVSAGEKQDVVRNLPADIARHVS
jgi:uncharacterized protein (DUF2267 family)